MNGLLIGIFALIAGFFMGMIAHAFAPLVILWWQEKHKNGADQEKGGNGT